MRRWVRGASAGIVTIGLLVAGTATPAGAVSTRSWPVTPASVGSLYGTVDPGGIGSIRVWGSAIWCYAQPTADASVAANLEALLAPSLDPLRDAGGGTAIVTIGHPAPWVFDNHPRALRPTKLWSCGDHASSVSIPSTASLKPNKDGSPSVQAQRWEAYVAAVVDFIVARYQGAIHVELETWNEPNLSSGLDPKLKVPGAAQSAKDAALALYRYESIARDVINSRGAQGIISLGSSALFTRKNTFSETYLKAHAKSPRIDAVHFNIYGFNAKTPTGAVSDWDKRAASVRSRLNKFKRLRSLPVYLTEANLNLVNKNSNRTNLKAAFRSDNEQRRMATATQMNAYFRGFQSVYWLVPWREQQASVFIKTHAGNPARDSLTVLQTALQGRTFAGCTSKKSVRTCTFVGGEGGRARVLWRVSGASTVRVSGASQVLEMTGAVRPVNGRERITTTPIVLR